MEVFSLLKYWKGGGGGGGCSTSSTASFVTAAGEHSDDDGPFFDLDFEGQNEAEEEEEKEEQNDVVGGVQPGPYLNNPDTPGTKLRVLMLKLRRSKSESTTSTTTKTTTKSEALRPCSFANHKEHGLNQIQNQSNNNGGNKKLLAVRFMAEAPILSLLSRASSNNSKLNTQQRPKQQQKQREEKQEERGGEDSLREKRRRREAAVQKYLRIVKRVPKGEDTAAMVAAMRRLNLRTTAAKTNSAVVHSVPIAAVARRRDDSVLWLGEEEEDGIQSAILHCKRSFNASTGG